MFDLNVPWASNTSNHDLQRTISFISELDYNVLALNYAITGAISSQVTNLIPSSLPFEIPKNITILRRCTVTLSDPSLNHRLPAFASAYDILALRPVTEKAFQAACGTITEHSLISMDLTIQHPFHFRPKPFMTAVKRGIRFEICYSQAVQGDSSARRNFISNVLAIVRATSGRGLVVSSGGSNVLGIRAPADVINLMQVWGMSADRAQEALTIIPRSIVVNEGIKRRGFRGIIDVVDGGKTISTRAQSGENRMTITATIGGNNEGAKNGKNEKIAKRKVEDRDRDLDKEATPQISKRQAKRLRLEALEAGKAPAGPIVPSVEGSASENPTNTNVEANG